MTDKPIDWTRTDPAYEQRIKRAIEQYFGRKPQPKRTARPSGAKQGPVGSKGWLF